MKRTLIIALTATGLVLAGPVAAHHNSPNSEFVETMMPADALEQHNAVVDGVLEEGNAMMAGEAEGTFQGLELDPANGAEDYPTDDTNGYGMVREPLM
jgi:hypothetical protein